MCHGKASAFFPTPEVKGEISTEIEALYFGDEGASKRLAILPDIYGANAFYQGLSTYLARKGCRVYLTNPFHEFGELPEVTREAAFERRHKLKDKDFIDRFEAFCNAQTVDGVIGFCLGGYYIFELARRNVNQDLVGFYGFPQGFQNQDPLQVPYEYLATIEKKHVSLMPGQDMSVGVENVNKLKEIADANANLQLTVYEASGHGFLADLDSDNSILRENALESLKQCEAALGV